MQSPGSKVYLIRRIQRERYIYLRMVVGRLEDLWWQISECMLFMLGFLRFFFAKKLKINTCGKPLKVFGLSLYYWQEVAF